MTDIISNVIFFVTVPLTLFVAFCFTRKRKSIRGYFIGLLLICGLMLLGLVLTLEGSDGWSIIIWPSLGLALTVIYTVGFLLLIALAKFLTWLLPRWIKTPATLNRAIFWLGLGAIILGPLLFIGISRAVYWLSQPPPPPATNLRILTTEYHQDENVAVSYSSALDPGLALSPDGQRLAICGPDAITLWDTATLTALSPSIMRQRGQQVGTRVIFSPDGKLLLCGLGNEFEVWDANTHTSVKRVYVSPETGFFLVFSPDGKRLAANQGAQITLFDARTWEPQGAPLQIQTRVINAVAFSPDSRTLAVNSIEGTSLLDVATRQPLGESFADNMYVSGMFYGPEGRELLTMVRDEGLVIWDLEAQPPVNRKIAINKENDCIAYSPSKKLLAWNTDAGTIVWDMQAKRQVDLRRITNNVIRTCPLFSADGSLLAIEKSNGDIALWNIGKP